MYIFRSPVFFSRHRDSLRSSFSPGNFFRIIAGGHRKGNDANLPKGLVRSWPMKKNIKNTRSIASER